MSVCDPVRGLAFREPRNMPASWSMAGPDSLAGSCSVPLLAPWLVCLLVSASSVNAAEKTPLDLLPDNTSLVLYIPSPDKLAHGIAEFGKAIGVDDLAEMDTATLLEDVDVLGDLSGVNTAAPMVLSFTRESDWLLCCTLSDEKEFRNSVKPEDVEDGELLIRGTLSGRCFAAIRDHVLVVSFGNRSVLKAALKSDGKSGERFFDHARSMADNAAAVFWVDGPALRTRIAEPLNSFEQKIRIGAGLMGSEAEAAVGFWSFTLDHIRRLVGDLDNYVAAIQLDKEGVRVQDRARFRKDTDTARYLERAKATSGDALRGLVDGPFAMAFCAEWESPDQESFYDRFIRSMVSIETLEKKVGKDKVEAALRTMTEMHKQVRGSAGLIRFDESSQSMHILQALYVDKPQELREKLRHCFELSPELMSLASGGPGFTVQQDLKSLSIETKSGTIQADSYNFKTRSDDPQLDRFLEMLFGVDSATIVVPLERHLLVVLAPASQARADIERSLSGAPPLRSNPRVSAALDKLAKNPQACALLDPRPLVSFAMRAAGTFGLPTPTLEFGNQTPGLIAAGIYLEPQSTHIELWVPSDAIHSVVSAFQKAMNKDAGSARR